MLLSDAIPSQRTWLASSSNQPPFVLTLSFSTLIPQYAWPFSILTPSLFYPAGNSGSLVCLGLELSAPGLYIRFVASPVMQSSRPPPVPPYESDAPETFVSSANLPRRSSAAFDPSFLLPFSAIGKAWVRAIWRSSTRCRWYHIIHFFLF